MNGFPGNRSKQAEPDSGGSELSSTKALFLSDPSRLAREGGLENDRCDAHGDDDMLFYGELVKTRGDTSGRVSLRAKPRLGRAWGRARSARRTVGLVWYTEPQWERLCELADDPGALDATYADWLRTAEQAVSDLRSIGVIAEKVLVDVEVVAAWCSRQRRPFNSAARAAYVAELLQQRQ